MNEDIAVANLGEDIGVCVGECCGADGFPGGVFEFGAVDFGDGEKIGVGKGRLACRVVLGGKSEFGEEKLEDSRRGLWRCFDADCIGESAGAEFFFNMFEEVFDFVVAEFDCGASGDAEGKDVGDAHAWEKIGEVVGDDFVEGDVEGGCVGGGLRFFVGAGCDGVNAEKAGEEVGDFESGESRRALVFGVCGFEDDAEVFREVGDEGKTVSRVDSQGGEDGENIRAVPLGECFGLFFGEVFVGDDVDVVFFERWDEVFVPAFGSSAFEFFDAFFAGIKGLAGREVAGA